MSASDPVLSVAVGPLVAGPLGIIVQARLGSTRLARKTLLPLGGATLLDMALARLSLVPADSRILATDAASAPELGPVAARNGFALVVGSAEDVLSRYCDAIRAHGLAGGLVLRATGDNPLVCHEAAIELIRTRGGLGFDYSSYSGLPLGMGVELVSAAALLRAEREAVAPDEREHVCPYLYRYPDRFSIDRPEAPLAFRFPAGRVTVDLPEDYDIMLRLYGAYYDGSPIPSQTILDALRSASGNQAKAGT